jgi:hypothetical protein
VTLHSGGDVCLVDVQMRGGEELGLGPARA